MDSPAPETPPPPPPRRYARLREAGKFLLIINLVVAVLVAAPLTLAALYEIQRSGSMAAGPRVWRVMGISDAAVVASLLLAAFTAWRLIRRRREALVALGFPAPEKRRR